MPLMRRRPLLRAAAVGGGAYVAGKHRARAQDSEATQDEQIADLQAGSSDAEPAAGSSGGGGLSPDAIERLKQLGQLHDQGVLTDEEFAQQKAALLGS